jgi:hypothetical protein
VLRVADRPVEFGDLRDARTVRPPVGVGESSLTKRLAETRIPAGCRRANSIGDGARKIALRFVQPIITARGDTVLSTSPLLVWFSALCHCAIAGRTRMVDQTPVTLDVEGRTFKTIVGTLTRVPGCYFDDFFRHGWKSRLNAVSFDTLSQLAN